MPRTHAHRWTGSEHCGPALLLLAALCIAVYPAGALHAQGPIDLARQQVTQLPAGSTSRDIQIFGVRLGMSWGEARNVLEQGNVPYIFQKGTSPVVYVPPTNASFYYILNPSSYDVIEMGIIGPGVLPLENQFLYDGQRWRLTTSRMQFFGSEGEFIINEEGEAFNFPYQGFVLKYLTPGTPDAFRFVIVLPSNKPLTKQGELMRPDMAARPPRPEPVKPQPPAAQPDAAPDALQQWLDQFARARAVFEEREYDRALDGFQAIAENAPDALLRIRAVYWTGECLHALHKYREAMKQFDRVIKETDIESLRRPAQLMRAQCARALR